MINHWKLVTYNQYEKELNKDVLRGKTKTRWHNCSRWRLMRKAFKKNWEVFHERYI